MKISTEARSLCYWQHAHHCHVYLNEKEIHCVEANEQAGTVVVHQTDEGGTPKQDQCGAFLRRVLKGSVRIYVPMHLRDYVPDSCA